LLVKLVVVIVGDQHHLDGRELPRIEREGGMPGDAKPDLPKHGVGQDILTLEMDPQGGMSEVGDRIPSTENFRQHRTHHGKARAIALGLAIRVRAQLPFQKAPERSRLVLRRPGLTNPGFRWWAFARDNASRSFPWPQLSGDSPHKHTASRRARHFSRNQFEDALGTGDEPRRNKCSSSCSSRRTRRNRLSGNVSAIDDILHSSLQPAPKLSPLYR